MKFSLFDIVHWQEGDTPSSYNAVHAAAAYDSHLDEWVEAEALGFDSIFFGEHHFTAYSLTPSPNLLVAALSQRTKRIRIGIMVNVLPFHDPLRLAEEGAMLDLLTHGCLEYWLGRGIGEQEFLKRGASYQEARSRFEEGLDVILKYWQHEEAEHIGCFYTVHRATIWPRPLQRPHPPIGITAMSDETIVWAAHAGYPMSSVFLPPEKTRERFDMYRKVATEAGHEVTPEHTVLARNIYVADTNEQARAEAEEALNHFFRLFIPANVPRDLQSLPDDYKYYREFFAPFFGTPMTFEDILAAGLVIVGSPETVARALQDQIAITGTGHLLCWMNFGNLSPEQVRRSERLFAHEVMSHVRESIPQKA